MSLEEETERTVDRAQFERSGEGRLRLVVIGDDIMTTYPLPERGSLSIGRGDESDVDIDHALISRAHARLLVDDGLFLEDLGSRNGTKVGGERLAPNQPRALEPGQLFEVGETPCLVQRSFRAAPARRIVTHGWFEAQLERRCAAGGRPFAVLRAHLSDERPLSEVHEHVAGATVVALYAPGELELLVEDSNEATRIAERLTKRLGARCHAAAYPSDGRTADALLEVACRGVLGEPTASDAGPIVRDEAMKNLYELVERIARGTISVLLLGETGVGKEVVAEAIHRASPRRGTPFLRLNCAALSETLLDSELFGHERGAFTGADEARPGLLESARGGTVFLDELGEMPLATQAKLLRVLEQRQVIRVGGREPIDVDVRFVAATNRDLEAEVVRGTFRQDVYFRLNGAVLAIPPLRERPAEIEALAARFAAEAAAELGLTSAPEIDDGAAEALLAYGWPGNIRELKNAIHRAVLLTSSDRIEREHLPLEKLSLPDERPATAGERDERRRILDALEKTAGNQTRAAELLGIGRRTLTTKLTKYGIRRPRKR